MRCRPWGRGGGEIPIYDIVRMYGLNSPLFQRCQVYDKPPLSKKNKWLTRFIIFDIWMILISGNPVWKKVSRGAKIRNLYNQVPHLTQDTNGKVTNSQLETTNESQEVSPFPAGDLKAHINRRAQRHSKHKTEQKKIHKRSTALERSVKYFTGGIKPVQRRQPHP